MASPTASWCGQAAFAEIAADLLAFFADSKLIAHNAAFDFGFLDMEFGRVGTPALAGTG